MTSEDFFAPDTETRVVWQHIRDRRWRKLFADGRPTRVIYVVDRWRQAQGWPRHPGLVHTLWRRLWRTR